MGLGSNSNSVYKVLYYNAKEKLCARNCLNCTRYTRDHCIVFANFTKDTGDYQMDFVLISFMLHDLSQTYRFK